MKESIAIQNQLIIKLKRRIYLSLLPLFIGAFTFLIIILSRNDELQFHGFITFSTLLVGLVLCCIFVLIRKHDTLYADLFLSLLVTVLFLINFYRLLLLELGHTGNVNLGPVAYWAPLLYLLFSFSFKGIVAYRLSILVFFLSLLPGIYHLFISSYANSYTFDTLIQFYISCFGYFSFLYFIRKIFEGSVQQDADKYYAVTDYLTNLPNRRRIDHLLHEEIIKAKQHQASLSVILFDVDYFKRINDLYGHDIGDEVLKQLSILIAKTLPENTYFGRWGGEEFIILALQTNKTKAMELAQAIKLALSEHPFEKVGLITCSFGITELKETDIPKDILKRADEALYLAKERGRNRIKVG
ncbi:GGDEF domain-containing protein [Pseudoneobacillus sp. C159]